MPISYNQTVPLPDAEYIVLSNIYKSAGNHLPLRQRELAQIAGASLGMTNSILKRLTQKGWITIKKVNSRNIQYAVTLEGINEIVLRSYRYFKRTIRNVVFFKDILEDVVSRAKKRNFHTVILAGSSDLDFIVEHACNRWGLNFVKGSGTRGKKETIDPGIFKIFAEGITEKEAIAASLPAIDSPAVNVFYLSSLIIKQTAATFERS